MAPAIKAALPSSGICASIQTAIRQGPGLNGGIDVLSLIDLQGTSRTCSLEYLFGGSPTGKMMHNNIEDIVQEICLYEPLWDIPFSPCSKWILHHSWIFAMCHYNYSNNISLHFLHAMLQPNREFDKSTMEVACQFFEDGASLKAIQRVRLPYYIYHISNICTAGGQYLNLDF